MTTILSPFRLIEIHSHHDDKKSKNNKFCTTPLEIAIRRQQLNYIDKDFS